MLSYAANNPPSPIIFASTSSTHAHPRNRTENAQHATRPKTSTRRRAKASNPDSLTEKNERDKINQQKSKVKLEIRKEVSCPPGDVTRQFETIHRTTRNNRQHNKQNTAKRERKDSKTEAQRKHLRGRRCSMVRVAQAGSTYVVGLVPCYPVCLILPTFVNPPRHSLECHP